MQQHIQRTSAPSHNDATTRAAYMARARHKMLPALAYAVTTMPGACKRTSIKATARPSRRAIITNETTDKRGLLRPKHTVIVHVQVAEKLVQVWDDTPLVRLRAN